MTGKDVIRPKLCFELPTVTEASGSINPPSRKPLRGLRGAALSIGANTAGFQKAAPDRASDPHPLPGSWVTQAGRRSGSRSGRTESSFMSVFVKKEKKMCVNCMMKLKPLVLNEKYESGPSRQEA